VLVALIASLDEEGFGLYFAAAAVIAAFDAAA
jgi:hypothetical protein